MFCSAETRRLERLIEHGMVWHSIALWMLGAKRESGSETQSHWSLNVMTSEQNISPWWSTKKQIFFEKTHWEREREKTGGVLWPAQKWALLSCVSLIEDSVKGGNSGDRQLLVSHSSPVSEPVVRFYQRHARRQRHTRHTQAVWCGTRDKRERAESGLSWDALYKDRITILIHRW